jgi:hypothetical protein
VKNYRLNKNVASFSNTLSATSWIQDRMQLELTGTLGELLIDLFGIY